jgi:hypothetical protein
MQQVIIPTAREIATMSWERCQYMRIRLKNEISFARGDEAIGGGSNEEAVEAYKKAIKMIDERLRELASIGEAGDQGVAAACSPEAPFPGNLHEAMTAAASASGIVSPRIGDASLRLNTCIRSASGSTL